MTSVRASGDSPAANPGMAPHDHAWRKVDDDTLVAAFPQYRCDLCSCVWSL